MKPPLGCIPAYPPGPRPDTDPLGVSCPSAPTVYAFIVPSLAFFANKYFPCGSARSIAGNEPAATVNGVSFFNVPFVFTENGEMVLSPPFATYTNSVAVPGFGLGPVEDPPPPHPAMRLIPIATRLARPARILT